MAHKEVIKDICGECPREYCTLREVALSSGMTDRFLEQIKCIEIFKWERSKSLGREVGWDEAGQLWAEEKHAQRFAEVYDGLLKTHPEMRFHHTDLYDLVMGRKTLPEGDTSTFIG